MCLLSAFDKQNGNRYLTYLGSHVACPSPYKDVEYPTWKLKDLLDLPPPTPLSEKGWDRLGEKLSLERSVVVLFLDSSLSFYWLTGIDYAG